MGEEIADSYVTEEAEEAVGEEKPEGSFGKEKNEK